jgi:hypothetical protein
MKVSPMIALRNLAFVLGALVVSSPAFGSAELARSKNCVACHHAERRMIGPAYNLIAGRYANDSAAVATLATLATATAAVATTAAAATVAAAAATAAAEAAAAAAAARSALGARLRLVDDEGASFEVLAVQGRDGRVAGVLVGHRHEAEAAGAAGLAIGSDEDVEHLTVTGEVDAEGVRRGAKAEISDIDAKHSFVAPTCQGTRPRRCPMPENNERS